MNKKYELWFHNLKERMGATSSLVHGPPLWRLRRRSSRTLSPILRLIMGMPLTAFDIAVAPARSVRPIL